LKTRDVTQGLDLAGAVVATWKTNNRIAAFLIENHAVTSAGLAIAVRNPLGRSLPVHTDA
jgi:hypothetical protein